MFLGSAPRTTGWLTVVASSTLILASGCAGQGSAEVDDVTMAAARFVHDANSDPAAACAVLAPKTLSELEASAGPCAQSLPEQHLPPASGTRHADVYGKDAIVHLEGDTVFLARFQDGWRVTAAGCTANGDQPYDCVVKGG